MPWILATLGLGGLVAYLVWRDNQGASASPAPATPAPVDAWGRPAGISQPTNNVQLTLVANMPVQIPVGIMLGASVSIFLPAGATGWVHPTSGSAMPGVGIPAAGTAPMTFQYQGPGAITLAWTDASGVVQTTTQTFYTVGAWGQSTLATGGLDITLVADRPVQLPAGVRLGTLVTIRLPADAKGWMQPPPGVSIPGVPPIISNPASGTTPIQWPYQGPGAVALMWVDAAGKTQVTTQAFYTQAF